MSWTPAEGWQTLAKTFKELDSQYHRSALTITALQNPEPESTAAQFPTTLRYDTAILKKHAGVKTENVIEVPDESPGGTSAIETTTPSVLTKQTKELISLKQ